MDARDIDSLRRGRLVLVATQVGAILTAVPVMTMMSLTDWPYAFGIALTCSLAFLLTAIWRRDAFLAHVWLFGLLFGVAELAVDAWLVHTTRTLSYADYAARGGPMWLASPAFMPLAWQVLVAHVATMGDAVAHWPRRRRLVFAVLVGAIYVPLGEALSIAAGFWSYHGVPIVGSVPLYIVAGETLLAVAIVLMLPTLERGRLTATAATAVAACGALWVGYAAGLQWI